MKKKRSLLSVLLAFMLVLTLTACGGSGKSEENNIEPMESAASETEEVSVEKSVEAPAEEPAEPEPEENALSEWAGEYSFLCSYLSAAYLEKNFGNGEAKADVPDQYVDMPDMAGETVTLNADGTGYLDWGEDNQGPIDSWTMDGDALEIKAGVSVISGTIEDGLMVLAFDEGLSMCFAAPDADVSGIETVSIEEFYEMLYGSDENGEAIEAVTAEDMPGEYTAVFVQNEGYLVYSDDLEVSTTLTLEAGGTGRMTFNDDAEEITSWTLEGDVLTLNMADGSSANCAVRKGIIELDIYGTGEMIIIYAGEGADTSSYVPMTIEELQAAYANQKPETRLYAYWDSLDFSTGVHLDYDRHVDFMDADQTFDVYGRDGVYYSARTTRAVGVENTVITFFRDGNVYNLFPGDMTGMLVTTTTSTIITDDVMRMDDLYYDIWQYSRKMDCTEETREVDGVTYNVEVFSEDAAFYFDDAGQLVYYSENLPEIGETFYTIRSIDGAVDESVFDISGYTIEE